MTRRALYHPDSHRPTRDMDPASLAALVAEATRRSVPKMEAIATGSGPTHVQTQPIELSDAMSVEVSGELSLDVLGSIEPSDSILIDSVAPPTVDATPAFLRIDVTTKIATLHPTGHAAYKTPNPTGGTMLRSRTRKRWFALAGVGAAMVSAVAIWMLV